LRFAATTGDQAAATRTVVVGFADLVGFTAISQQLNEHELAAMVDRFEALAYEHIPERGGRVVKMIGDEVMFSVESAAAAAEMALALVEAFASDPALPDVRAGLALGPTLSWEGDLFGNTVNLASRLVNLARPGTVLISDELGYELEAQGIFELRHLRPLSLKGIGRVRAWVLRRRPVRALA
jgi:adenylate cyclase